MKAHLLPLILSMGLVTTGPAAAQRPATGIPTLTLYVKQFGELERRLLDAQAQQDLATMDGLLSPLFEVRSSGAALQSREAWLAAQREARTSAGARISQLSVYETGTHAVANFRLSDGQGNERYIVDVWAPADNAQWQLRVRFESPLK